MPDRSAAGAPTTEPPLLSPDEAVAVARDVLASRRSYDCCDRGECFYPTVVQLAQALLARAEAGT